MFQSDSGDVADVAMEFVKAMEKTPQNIVRYPGTDDQGSHQRSGFCCTFRIPFLTGSAVCYCSGMPPDPAVKTVFEMVFVGPYHVDQDSISAELYFGRRPF